MSKHADGEAVSQQLTTEDIIKQSWSPSLVDSMANELGNPRDDVNCNGNGNVTRSTSKGHRGQDGQDPLRGINQLEGS